MMNFLFLPYGRISRTAYWVNWIVPYVLISLGAIVLDSILFPKDEAGRTPPVFQVIAAAVFFWPLIAITTKRLHDRGMTGWWQIAPAVAVILLAVVAFWYYTVNLQAGTDAGANLAVATVLAVVTMIVGSIVAWVILYPLVNVLFLRGQDGPNKYGEDPLGARSQTRSPDARHAARVTR